jgi:hypothetical protein
LITNLASLENISPNSIESLKISSNENLSSCEAESICSYLASPGCQAEITDNAPGCNSFEEVSVVCNPGGYDEAIIAKDYAVYPNPFRQAVIIEYKLVDNSEVIITIFNQLGQEIAEVMNAQQSAGLYQVGWNGDDLPQGVYFCQLRTGNQLYQKKIIKF